MNSRQIITALAVILILAAWFFRFEIEPRLEGTGVVRLDRWTGGIVVCGPSRGSYIYDCSGRR